MTHETHARIAALVTAGFLAATAGGTAYADTATSGNGSIGGGNQIGADIDAPINICGNSIAVLGIAAANCADGDAVIANGPDPDSGTDTDSSSTSGPHDGYEDSEKPPEEETPAEEPPVETEELAEESPEEPLGPEGPAEEAPKEEAEGPAEEDEVSAEERTEPDAAAGAVSQVGQELALTGADNTSLYGLVAAAVAAIAVGAGLVFAGLRRRTRA